MKKFLIALFAMVPVTLFLGWFAVSKDNSQLIRRDLLEIAAAFLICGLTLTVGYLTDRLKLASVALQSAAVIYIICQIGFIFFSDGWTEPWQVRLPVSLVFLVFASLPAALVFGLARTVMREQGKEFDG